MAMAKAPRIEHGRYTDVVYLQHHAPRWLAVARAVASALTWPVVWPLAWLARRSDILFRTVSEALSLIPYALGVVVRGEFYRFALTRCGRNVVVELGAVFVFRDIVIGDHVTINRYAIVHHCDIGSYALIGEHVVLLSGSRQHDLDRTDSPMALQQGRKKRIVLGDDVWIGAHAVVMEDVGTGAVVGAGSIVTRPVDDYMIVAGNPARPQRRRGSPRPGATEPHAATMPMADTGVTRNGETCGGHDDVRDPAGPRS
jgi:acetyltransferase-like isoleucine patch superfamily enzyme